MVPETERYWYRMVALGFHASHEQISPQQLLRDVVRAEEAGFVAAMCSDHYFPWSVRQGHSGHSFSWLGAALASTSIPIGSVHAPGQRSHPAIAAQATATLGAMFPGRYWVALGSGQNLNEHVTGDKWLDLETRRTRLEESVQVIRALHQGERVSHKGLVTVEDAYLYDRPEDPIPLYATCISPASAERAATWADGMITVNQPGDKHVETLRRFRDSGGTGPAMLQAHLSWAPTQQEADDLAYEQWRSNTVPELAAQLLPTPEHFDAVTESVPRATVREAVWVATDAAHFLDRIAAADEAGFDQVYLHHVGQEQQAWLDFAGSHVLPEV